MSERATMVTLYASLWHALFFTPGHADDTSSTAVIARTLDRLGAAGFTKAGDLLARLPGKGEAADADGWACVRRTLDEAVTRAEAEGSAGWVQLLLAKTASALLSGEAVSLRASLAAMPRPPTLHAEALPLLPALAAELCATAAVEDRAGHPALFSLMDTTKAQLAAHTTDESRTFLEARLYAALCLHGLFPTVRPLAKLLVAYMHQDGQPVAGGVGEGGAAAEALRHRAETRARGVIAGLLECALATAEGAPTSLREALNAFPTLCAGSESTALPFLGPRPEQCVSLLTSAALTLVHLVRHADELRASTGADTRLLSGASLSRLIIHTVQELLFTAVLGAGTMNMPNRPIRPSTTAAAAADTHATVTHRPLTLREADAVTHDIFPRLLQQVGYEWPWSELLRHCRGLDKVQVAPPFPYVALPSSLVVDTVLLRLASCTYPERLHNLLPASFDTTRRKLGIEPPRPVPLDADADHGGEGGGDGDEAPRRRTPDLFRVPAYYEKAVTPLLDHYTRTGLGGLRVEEVERLLRQSVSTLPMTVQLRALAPPAEGGDGSDGAAVPRGKDTRDYPLTGARVAVLETRYMLEVLLVSVVVHTQLETHSQVQGMMRELAPLVAKLSMTLGRYSAALATPLLTRRSSAGVDMGGGDESPTTASNSSSSGSLVFSDEAERLMNDLGYEFYPLEWLPALAESYHEQQQQQHERRGKAATTTLLTGVAGAGAGGVLPYSAFAAVAHQLGASFAGSVVGSERGNCPAGARAPLVVRPPAPSTLVSERQDRDGSGVAAMARAVRVLEALMLPCWLDSRLSSGSLEGTMAVTATRVVVGSGPGGAVGVSDDTVLARLRQLLKPSVLEMFWADEEAEESMRGVVSGKATGGSPGASATTDSRKRERDDGSTSGGAGNGQRFLERDEEAVRALANALLRNGASSYELSMEAKDFVLTVAQCFLPSTGGAWATAGAGAEGGKPGTRRAPLGAKVTVELMRGAMAWCQAAAGSPAVRAEVRMQLQQQSVPAGDASGQNGSSAVDRVFATVYNSGTFDTCEWARRVLWREVPARLLAKLRLRQQQSEDLLRRRDRCIRRMQGTGRASTVGAGEVDPLLTHQWSQYVNLMQRFALAGDGGGMPGDAPELSAAQWVWYSPYASY